MEIIAWDYYCQTNLLFAGDLKHPRCSACVEAAWECIYSRTRRKPGPAKGSRRRPQQRQELLLNTGSPASHQLLPMCEGNAAPQMPTLNETVPLVYQPNLDLQHSIPTLPFVGSDPLGTEFLQLVAGQRDELINGYLTTINTAFPLFRSSAILESFENGTIHNTLQFTICAVSAKVTDGYFPCGVADIDATLSYLLSCTTVEIEGIVEPAALNQWQTACLLIWYGFHQYPGQGETNRIAVLIRKAYQYGLHQIDSKDNQASFGWNLVSEEILEDWRHVWWCLYFLDCYASFSSAIPHQVETQSLRTALLQDFSPLQRNQNNPDKVFLPPDSAGLWRIVQDTSNTGGNHRFSLHMAASMLLKEVLTINRLNKQNPCQSFRDRMSALEDHLSAVQLALPINYLRHTRDLLGGESVPSYHSRLLVLLKIDSMRLLLRFPYRALEMNEWETRWQETLEICYRLTAIFQHWDTQYLRAIDPAVCFIGLSLLVCFHLHSMSNGALNPALREQLDRRKLIVRLFLHHYASYWNLPRVLLDYYNAFEGRITNQLRSEDIDQIINQFQGPLLQRWLDPPSLTARETAFTHFSSGFPELPISFAESNSIAKNRLIDVYQDWDSFSSL